MCNDHSGHSHHHFEEYEKGAGILSLVKIAFPVVLLVCAMLLNLPEFLKFTLFIAAYLAAGANILYSAFKNILKGEIFDENSLMTIATLGAISIKEYPEAVTVMLLFQIGEYFQNRAVCKSKKSITELMDIRPDFANIEDKGVIKKVVPDKVEIGDIIVVRTGEKIPLDGIVTEGKAVIDTSALTGEAAPVEISKGQRATSGCINTNGVLKIEVTKKFEESTVSKIMELVKYASTKKAKTENFITKFAKYYTPAVVSGAILVALFPPLLAGGEFSVWFERALTFLVISCPCALVISVPLGFFAGIGGASKSGILIKGSGYIEALSKAKTVAFDKTGTLTKGSFRVVKIAPQAPYTKEELLELAATAEAYSAHPIALSLKSAHGKEINTALLSDIKEIAGNGVRAKLEGETVLVGNDKLLKSFDINFEEQSENGTVIYAAKNNKYWGYIVISDEVKEDAGETIKSLGALGIETVMLTGDSKSAAEFVAGELRINKYWAKLLPFDKVKKIEELINEKPKNSAVVFAGDGINDAPVLTRADVGVSMGVLGTDAAIEASDVVIMDDKVSKILSAIKISKKTIGVVKQNIVFAIGVKALFLILGALGLITMWGAVFADVGVTLLTVLNSLRALNVKA